MKYENIEFMKRLKFWRMKTINQLKASGRCLKTPAFFMCFSSGRRGDYQHPVDQNPFLLPSHSLEKSFSGWKGSLSHLYLQSTPIWSFRFLPIQSYSILVFMEETGEMKYLMYQSIIFYLKIMRFFFIKLRSFI